MKDSGVAQMFSVALEVTAGTLLLLLYSVATCKTAVTKSATVGCTDICQKLECDARSAASSPREPELWSGCEIDNWCGIRDENAIG